MDLRSLHVKGTNGGPKFSSSWLSNSWAEKPFSCKFQRLGLSGVDDETVADIGFMKMKLSSSAAAASCRSRIAVRATGKKKHGDSSGGNDRSKPEGDGSRGSDSTPDSNKFDDTTTHKAHHKISDWRDFRAHLVAREQAEIVDVDTSKDKISHKGSKLLGSKWAHPIPVPEAGCVLVAKEKLDGVPSFERTVILLLSIGSNDPLKGPVGIVLNRPLHKKIKQMKPTNLDLATTFADCSLDFGGPLEANMFLLKTGEDLRLPGFEQVIPGLCYGARSNLEHAAALVKKGVLKTQDFRFFYGYAGWELDQLTEEIDSDYWIVAACSANLLFGGLLNSSKDLWVEILELMGGHYSDISRKPKQDD